MTAADDRDGVLAARLRAAFDAHYDFVWRSLVRLGTPAAVADDLAQEVFVVLARRLGSVAAGAEKRFLFGVAMQFARNELRARRRRGVTESDGIDLLEDPSPGPESVLEQRRARELLAAVLDAMADELRVVLVLAELEEMTMAEIATLLDLAPGTVASRLRRAREDFEHRVARLRRVR
jgi:RNA polymerase sigma-70 factor (ECF subfamily)